jgi:lipopolysaccharide transport system ATP-binding protein
MSSDTQPLIEVKNLGKAFRLYENRWRKIQGAFFEGSNHSRKRWALRHLDFAIGPGRTMGIIGVNGSGKTTLLQLLAGLLKPTEGSVSVRGNLATLLELGGGFQMDLTGRENILLMAGIRGFSKREVESKLESIIEFSELQEFIEQPIKHYSSGMLMRLAFATAINVEPQILLIDEVFAVGDMAFQHKCTRRFRELQKKGASVVLVTHDMTAVKSLCDIALLLDQGLPVKLGSPEDVTNTYVNLIAQKIAAEHYSEADEEGTSAPENANNAFVMNIPDNKAVHRHGTGEGKIRAVELLNSKGLPTQLVSFGEEITLRFYLEYFTDLPNSGLGFYLRDRYGNDILGINTFEEGRNLGGRKKGDRLIVDFKLPLHLRPGSYSVSPGFSYDPNEMRYLDWIDNAFFFQMEKPANGKTIHGLVHVPNQVSIQVVNQDV